MTIQQCKYVLEIAKTGSFSEAAKQLFIADIFRWLKSTKRSIRKRTIFYL